MCMASTTRRARIASSTLARPHGGRNGKACSQSTRVNSIGTRSSSALATATSHLRCQLATAAHTRRSTASRWASSRAHSGPRLVVVLARSCSSLGTAPVSTCSNSTSKAASSNTLTRSCAHHMAWLRQCRPCAGCPPAPYSSSSTADCRRKVMRSRHRRCSRCSLLGSLWFTMSSPQVARTTPSFSIRGSARRHRTQLDTIFASACVLWRAWRCAVQENTFSIVTYQRLTQASAASAAMMQ
mmetsp:Transcript_52759/g.118429  ORF Transcript_52759/g.118429 Transcript_52759/m.118429 type:complete len:241 (+) Transcript_52759:191-913(+)